MAGPPVPPAVVGRRLATITRLVEEDDLAAARQVRVPGGRNRPYALVSPGIGAFRGGEYAEARRLSDEAAAGDRGDASLVVNARWLSGVASHALGDHDGAIRMLGGALTEDWERDLRAEVALTRGEDELALELLSARRATPTEEATRLNGLGRLRLQRAEYAEADRLLAESLELLANLDPEEAAATKTHARLLRGHTAVWSGHATEAVDHVRAALTCWAALPASTRRSGGTHDVAAIILAAAGQPAEASEHLTTALAEDDGTQPRRAQLLWARAENEAARGDMAAARTTFSEAIELLDRLSEAPKAGWLRGRLTELGLA